MPPSVYSAIPALEPYLPTVPVARLILPVLLGVALLALPGRAAAHAELVSSDPAANASLMVPPERISLTFSEAIDPVATTITLLDPQQVEVAGLGEVDLDADASTATVRLPELEPGIYTVSYQVTSAVDGHVTSGILAFLVDPTGIEPPPTTGSQSESVSSTFDVIMARWLALAAGLTLLGVAVFWLWSARPAIRGAARGPSAAALAPWGALALAGVAAVALLAFYLARAARPILEHAGGSTHGAGFPLDFAAPFGWTPFAIAMRVGLLGAAAAAFLAIGRFVMLDERRRHREAVDDRHDAAWLAIVAAAAGLSLAGSSLGAHGASLGGPLFAAIDWVHLLGVAAWLGALPGIVLLAIRVRSTGSPATRPLSAALRRHSTLALVAAPVVVLTGVANSPLVLGAAREVVASGYGNLLLAKAGLFSVAVAIGSANYFLIRRGAAGRALVLIGIELVVAALAVLAAAGMVTGQPSAGRMPVLTSSAIGTAHLYGTAGESSVHAAINLPAPGSQRYQVSVAEAASGTPRTDVQRVILVFAPPDTSGLPSQRVELQVADEPWLWGTSGAYTPIVGDWGLEVIVRRVGVPDESTAFALPVREPLPPQRVPPPDIGVGVPLTLQAAWSVLPAGTLAWAIPVGPLAVAGSLGLALRGRAGPRRSALAVTMAVLVAAGVGSGLLVGSRAVVQAANRATAAQAAATNPVPADADSIERGTSLYLANCSVCHGVTGAGDGPAADAWARPVPLSAVVPDLTDGELAYRIATGTVGTRMPAYATTLSENDRWDLVNYLRATWGAP